MPSNNEHIALRRRMERRLGQSVSQAAWDFAAGQGHVEVALDSEFWPAGEEGLYTFLTGLLHVEDADLRARVNSRPKTTGPLPRPYPDLSARVEAVSRLAAEHAAGDEEILRFRKGVLGRDTPMSPKEAGAYLDGREIRGTPSLPGDVAQILRYQNLKVAYEMHVWPGSPLDALRGLAESLAKFYPWEPAQAAAFVLEGLTPLATPFMLRFPQTWHETRPTRAKLVMEVDIWTPASSVLRAYRDVQRHVLPGHNRPVSRRSIDLVNFVMAHRPDTWQKLLERWNTEHPTAVYSDYRRFRYAFVRARQSLLYPTYRPYFGPDYEGNHA